MEDRYEKELKDQCDTIIERMNSVFYPLIASGEIKKNASENFYTIEFLLKGGNGYILTKFESVDMHQLVQGNYVLSIRMKHVVETFQDFLLKEGISAIMKKKK